MVITMTDDDVTRGSGEYGNGRPPGTTDEEISGETSGAADLVDEAECDVVEVDILEAKAAALASVSTVELAARGSAIGKASVEGDAEVSGSLVGVVNAGSVGLYRGAALVMVGDGESAIEQGFAEVVVTRAIGLNKSGAGVVVANDASVARSWVGVMAARNATLTADSRVIIDAKAILVLAMAVLAGLGAFAMFFMPRRRHAFARRMHMPWARHHGMAERLAGSLPHLQAADMAKLAELAKIPALAGLMSRLHLGR